MTAMPRFGRVAVGVAQKHLDALGNATVGVVSAVLMSADGFEVASLQVGKGGAARLAAMGSSLSAIGSAIAREAGIVDCNRMIIQADTGTVVVMNIPTAKPPMSLAVVANEEAVLGKLLWAASNCCAAVGRAFGE
ncbi:roadblock/LC7 domain-containing protein [Tahibacter amnicola]|uniref:Roadblock/LC7 domain-containing protein n=1 Tax=Tahibacter amnicola TaxID=2976241 RepID=A0ABY6BBK4_9GAMM|nr:roadblock/LC7 domain-containing protein [Tahibacter amnicola]UXI67429.1 roadblock/LC7 domain-containing protein [Tahibacter amnicola]